MDLDDDLFDRLRAGDEAAADEVFRRYAERLVRLAGAQLSARLSARFDPEDVVQSAYCSFFRGVNDGRIDPGRGGDLWALLAAVTLNKLDHLVRRNRAQRRAIGREQAADLADARDPTRDLAAREPTPLEAAALADEVTVVMAGLPDLARRMLELRLQGYDVDEIGRETGRAQCTVRRVLKDIRARLENLRRKAAAS